MLLHQSDGWANLTLLSASAFFPPVFAGCLLGEARDWPVKSGSDLFLLVLMYYKVVLLKMYLAQENRVKSQLAKIPTKLWLLLGLKCLGCCTCLLNMNEPIHKDWKLAWKGYPTSYSASLLIGTSAGSKGAKNVIHLEGVDLVRKPVI